jgi:hypothetical protein
MTYNPAQEAKRLALTLAPGDAVVVGRWSGYRHEHRAGHVQRLTPTGRIVVLLDGMPAPVTLGPDGTEYGRGTRSWGPGPWRLTTPERRAQEEAQREERIERERLQRDLRALGLDREDREAALTRLDALVALARRVL